MPSQERDEGCQAHNYEEWQASHPGSMSLVWHQDVPNRKSLTQLGIKSLRARLDMCAHGISSLLASYFIYWLDKAKVGT